MINTDLVLIGILSIAFIYGYMRGIINMLKPLFALLIANIVKPLVSEWLITTELGSIFENYIVTESAEVVTVLPVVGEYLSEAVASATNIISFCIAFFLARIILTAVVGVVKPVIPFSKKIDRLCGGGAGVFVAIAMLYILFHLSLSVYGVGIQYVDMFIDMVHSSKVAMFIVSAFGENVVPAIKEVLNDVVGE